MDITRNPGGIVTTEPIYVYDFSEYFYRLLVKDFESIQSTQFVLDGPTRIYPVHTTMTIIDDDNNDDDDDGDDNGDEGQRRMIMTKVDDDGDR